MKKIKKNQSPLSFSKKGKIRSDFANRVVAVVSKIPKGKVMTYGEVARKAGKAGASRAVGYWMSKNYDLKIPCHRVIRSDGKIGNYNRGGTKAKTALLKKEGAVL
ncbi:MGMT family protein [Acetobacteraceae bacterium]|nr:MGMT family protein [Candidatus Parcubacteria bacterium]